MSQVLYRKHRSQIFDELVGQDHIVSILKNAVSKGQIAHAYLLYGPRGLGKTSTARILAKAVNCLQLQPDGNPCNTCVNCVSIREGKFLDLIEIDAASNRGIDQIRELKERIEFSPSEGKKKVYIIDEVHMLTTEAFNALLKTLEEPPPHAIFILATTEIHKIPATIMSRCQRFDFRLGTDGDIQNLLSGVAAQEEIRLDEKAMELIVENARGSYRDALSLLDVVVSGQKKSDDPRSIEEEEVRAVLGLADSTMAYFFLEKLVKGQAGEALDLVGELAQKGVNLGQFVTGVLSVLREILIGGLRGEVDPMEYSFAVSLDRKKTLRLITLFVEAERSLKDSLVPTLPLEILIADAMELFPLEDEGSGSPIPVSPSQEDSGSGSSPSKGTPATKLRRKNTPGETKSTAKKEGPLTNRTKDMQSEKRSISTPKNSKLSLLPEELEKQWTVVLQELRAFNSHLYAFIGRSRVESLKNGVLTLAVPFDFHKDRLESVRSRDAVAAVFKKVFGSPVKLECVLDDSICSSVTPAAESVVMEDSPVAEVVSAVSKTVNIYDSVAEVFGDELISM